jgi:hypothetical protein
VWSYPLFLLSLIDNPAPLLLYDRIIIDDRAAPLAIEYALEKRHDGVYEDTQLSRQSHNDLVHRVDLLEELLESELFHHERFETLLDPSDLDDIARRMEREFRREHSWLRDEVDYLQQIYGPHYAAPDPFSFEVMNIHLIWQISEKLADRGTDVSILDDCARGRLYRAKVYQLVSESVRHKVANEFIGRLPTFVLGLPSVKLTNVESFLELHHSSELGDFRQVVSAIAMEPDPEERDRLIQRELYRANDAVFQIDEGFDMANLFGLILSVGVSAAALIQDIAWLAGLGFASASLQAWPAIRNARQRLSRRQKWEWFVRLKSFAEEQAGFNEALETPWPLSEL